MGIARSAGKLVGGLIFSLALAATITAIGLSDFTSRGSVVPFLTNILGPYATSAIRQSAQGADNYSQRQAAIAMCEGKDTLQSGQIDTSSLGGGSLQISLNCSELVAAVGSSPDVAATVGNLTAKSVANTMYDYDYTCGFVDCMRTGKLLVVMSAEGNAFLRSAQPALVIVTAAGAVMLLVANYNWAERLKSIGTRTAIVGVTYFIFSFGRPYLMSAMVPPATASQLATAGIDVGTMVDGMVSPMMDMLLYAFVAGVAIAAVGYIVGWRWPSKEQPQERKSVLDK